MKKGAKPAHSLLIDFLNRNPVLSFIKDEEGRYLYVNKSFLEFFGISKKSVLGKTDFDWLPYETAKHFTDNDQHVRSSGKALETIEETHLPRGVIYCLVHKFPVQDLTGGKMVGGIATDITARLETENALKRASQELSLARDQALEISALKSRFITNVSHELRTPLTGIIAAIELLTRTTPSEEQLTLLKIAEESSLTLLALVNNILDLSKIEAGKMELECELFNPAVLLQECVNGSAAEAKNKKLTITSKISNQIPESVKGDQLRVRQALLNLIGNAIKFTETGEITVEARLEGESWAQRETTDGMINIRFIVKDTGIGIAEEEQHLLFKPFSQVDSSSTRKHTGSGLGLYLSKQLVEIMGGMMVINSSKGNGTVCSFVIPFQAVDESFRSVQLVCPSGVPASSS